MRSKLVLLLIVVLLAFLSGCAQEVNTEEPPAIAYGQDVCDRCGMIISEEKFAAAYWTAGGEARRFDDIGGMADYVAEEGEAVATYWVHDFVSGEWIRGEAATYVVGGGLMTPMGFGVAAFSDAAQAQAFAHGNEGAEVVSFAELLVRLAVAPETGEHVDESGSHME
jgi:copper chaperone NosL